VSTWSCNISRTGRVVRICIGLLLLAAGIYLILAIDSAFWGTGLCTLGAFGIFEGIKGWCAMRAMGFKTPF